MASLFHLNKSVYWDQMINDPLLQKWEYVGWIEKIFEFNYMVINNVVFSNWVKANYIGNNAMVKRDEYGFALVKFNSFIPISDQSFAFPIHVE